MRRFSLPVFFALTVIIALNIAFYLTNFIQEDAFISWRCAGTLIRTGVYGFNDGEKVSASTTHLYVFISAGIKLVAGNLFLPVILLLNFVALTTGIYLIAASIFKDYRKKLLLWFFLSVSPVTFVISASGMETAYVILLIGILAFGLRYDKVLLSTFAIIIFPWFRPDAVALCLIFVFVHYFKNRRFSATLILALGIGICSVLLFNYMYFGDFLHQTIIAKKVAYKNTYGLSLPAAAYRVFLENGGLYSPFYSKYLTAIGGLFVAVTLWAGIFSIQKNRIDREKSTVIIFLFGIAFIIPLLYVAGGVIFEWYLWPSSIAASCLISMWVIDSFIFKNEKFSVNIFAIVIILVLISCAGQWRQRFYMGTYELYRKNIGLYLKSIAQPNDTLMLEPAGYIPYYSQLYVYDEIGLVSPEITKYRIKFSNAWWIEFLKDKKPKYLLQRVNMRKFITLDEYPLDKKEKEWFVNNYELINELRFDYRSVRSNAFALRIMEGAAPVPSFYLYRVKPAK